MKVYNNLIKTIENKGAAYLILIDPDKLPIDKVKDFVNLAESSGADGFLIGGSLMITNHFNQFSEAVKSSTSLPVIIFPGSESQINENADALLYISLISGRNADQIFGKHVLAAPVIKQLNIEPISTGYMLIESGRMTTAEYVSGSKPIPRNKPEIAAATALAAEYMGFKLIYLEAGSGADNSVPDEMVKLVSKTVNIPVIVGGGIKSSSAAREKVKNGAKIIVTGNFFEAESNWKLITDFADAIHFKEPLRV